MPKVSICIPTYNQVEYLRKTLESVLKQDYVDYEIIITDDSPDNCVRNLVFGYDFKGKLKYYKNAKSLGSPENWNEVVRKATGEYIKMLHHDDYFTFPYSLGDYVTMLDENTDSDFAFSAAIAVNIDENKTRIHSATKLQLEHLKNDARCLFFENFVGPPSSIIYRNKPRLEFDKKLKWVVDIDFYIQCLLKNGSFIFTEKPLITSISGANHNVTNDCINNGDLEVFEYLYLYDKLSKTKSLKRKNYTHFFKVLFSKYNIKSKREIIKAGFKKRLPLSLALLLFSRKLRYVVQK